MEDVSRTVRMPPALGAPYFGADKQSVAKDIYRDFMENSVRKAVSDEVSKRIDRRYRRTPLRTILLRSTSEAAIVAAGIA